MKRREFRLNQKVRVVGPFMQGREGVIHSMGTGNTYNVLIYPSGIVIAFNEAELEALDA